MFKLIVKAIRQFLSSHNSESQSLQNKLIKGVASSFGIRITSSGLTFVMSILLARCLGTTGLGIYSYATTWANLLSVPASLGIDQLIVREFAVYRARSRWGLMKGILNWANLTVLSFSIILTLAVMAIAWNTKISTNREVTLAIILALVTIPITSIRNVRLGAMKGLHKIVLGQLPDSLFAPVIVISAIVFLYLFFPTSINVFSILWIKIFSIFVTFLVGTWWLWKSLPNQVQKAKPELISKSWLIDALPFMFMGTAQLITSRIDIIMLGSIVGIKEVGIYAVIFGISQLTIFIHQAANSALSPTIATLFSENKLDQLEKIICKSVLTIFLISLVIGITMMGLGKYLLMIFGTEFISGWVAMNILIVGQIFNALTGPVGIVLNMTGYQNYTAISTGISAILNIILNTILIPQWGIKGAAIATTTSMIVINIIKVIIMRKKLGILLYSFSKFH